MYITIREQKVYCYFSYIIILKMLCKLSFIYLHLCMYCSRWFYPKWRTTEEEKQFITVLPITCKIDALLTRCLRLWFSKKQKAWSLCLRLTIHLITPMTQNHEALFLIPGSTHDICVLWWMSRLASLSVFTGLWVHIVLIALLLTDFFSCSFLVVVFSAHFLFFFSYQRTLSFQGEVCAGFPLAYTHTHTFTVLSWSLYVPAWSLFMDWYKMSDEAPALFIFVWSSLNSHKYDMIIAYNILLLKFNMFRLVVIPWGQILDGPISPDGRCVV